MRILVLDDEQIMCSLFQSILCGNFKGCEVEVANAPSVALNLFNEKPNFDMVFTDYNMPEMNGLEFAKELKQISDIPVVMVTGAYTKELQKSGELRGITVIAKPFLMDDIVRAVGENVH